MSTEDILAELRDSYLNGFPGQLHEIEAFILELEKSDNTKDPLEALYRRVHSIKGSAGTFGFSIISSICHQMEDHLTEVEEEGSKIDSKEINVLFAYLDLLNETYEGIAANSLDTGSIEKKLDSIGKKTQAAAKKCICIGFDNNDMYHQIIHETAKAHNIQCSFVESSLTALERLLHEHFDVLITARENQDLNGIALVAAIRLNKQKNAGIKSILITSNQEVGLSQDIKPEYIIFKNQDFPKTLFATLSEIS